MSKWTREGHDYFNDNGLRITKVNSPLPGHNEKFWVVVDLDGKMISPYRRYLKDAKKDGDDWSGYNRRWNSDHLM